MHCNGTKLLLNCCYKVGAFVKLALPLKCADNSFANVAIWVHCSSTLSSMCMKISVAFSATRE